MMENPNVSAVDTPLSEKLLLSVTEAARYSGIGINRLSSMLNEPNCPFVMRVGRRRLVKREEFERFIKETDHI